MTKIKKFCPKCGKTIEKNTFCEDCAPTELVFKEIKIKLCPSKKYFFKGKWKPFEDLKKLTETIMLNATQKKIKVISGLEAHPELLQKTGLKKNIDTKILVEKKVFEIPINVEITYSPVYGKVGSTYFEGILQIRNADTEIKNFVKKTINKTNNSYVNKTVEKKDSVDFYFVKKRVIPQVAQKVIEEYGAYSEQNAQLFTQDKQTSKDLYRLNVVVHIPPFRKKDVVLTKNHLLLIKKTSKQINATDLKTGKTLSFKYEPNKKHEYKIIKKQKTKLINTHPNSVLSDESYEVIELMNTQKVPLKKEQQITIVEHENKAYLVK